MFFLINWLHLCWLFLVAAHLWAECLVVELERKSGQVSILVELVEDVRYPHNLQLPLAHFEDLFPRRQKTWISFNFFIADSNHFYPRILV